MPRYMGECGSCGHIGEYYFSSGDRKVCSCHECGDKFNLDGNRRYDLEGLQIQGDTCPGGTSYNYYDEHLGAHVTSRRHRQSLMDAQGLQEYSPDPTMAKTWGEVDYILDAAPKGDKQATAAANEIVKVADRKRKLDAARKAISSVKL